MDVLYCCVLLCAIFGISAAEPYFVITAPNVFHYNSEETVSVSVFERDNVGVELHLKIPGSEAPIFSTGRFIVNEDDPQLKKLTLRAEDIVPPRETAEKPRVITISAITDIGSKDVDVMLAYDPGYIFVQTNKPIYVPRENVKIRVMPLTEKFRPAQNWPLIVDVKNPDGVIIERKNKTILEEFTQFEFEMQNSPSTGVWSVQAYFGGMMEKKTTAHFQVKEYVLPTYGVVFEKLDPPFIVEETLNTTVHVKANFTYGEPVRGTARLSVLWRNPRDEEEHLLAKYGPTFLSEDGTASFLIDTNMIKLKIRELDQDAWFPEGQRLKLIAEVVEDPTGTRSVAVDKSLLFAKSPYYFKFTRSRKHFKPAISFFFKIDAYTANGQIASNIPILVKHKMGDEESEEKEVRTDENGRHTQAVDTDFGADEVTLMVRHPNHARTDANFTVLQYTSPNNNFVQIEPDTDQGELIVKATSNADNAVDFTAMTFLIVSKGKIVHVEQKDAGIERTITPEITDKMVPSARFLVYYMDKRNGEVVADSVKFDNIPKKCEGDRELHLALEDGRNVEPGIQGTLKVNGPRGMKVGLNVLDTAVLLLNKTGVLRRNWMFDSMESHDLGCGPGGGQNSRDVFQKTGLTVLTNAELEIERRTHKGCDEASTRKRRYAVYTPVEIKDMCCKAGDQYGAAHSEEECYSEALHKMKTFKLRHACVLQFYKCCKQASYAGERSGFDDTADYFADLEEAGLSDSQLQVRTEFKESWLWELKTIGENGQIAISAQFPHSITEWMFQAVGISEDFGLCIANPLNVVASRPFFIHLDLPYKAIRYEQIEVRAVIYNYRNQEATLGVYMEGRRGLCSNTKPGKKSKKKSVTIGANRAAVVTFPIVPLKKGKYDILITALQANGVYDAIKKPLFVEYEGVEETITIPLCVDPNNRKKICDNSHPKVTSVERANGKHTFTLNTELPNDAIHGTASLAVYGTGENVMDRVVDTLLDDIDSLFKGQPYGCGEQTMITTVPTLYAMLYLKQTDQVTAQIEENGMEWIRYGIVREKTNYRHPDGSFATWLSRGSSTWLTAFVLKVFCQSRDVIDEVNIENDVCPGMNWLTTMQKEDGSFVENNWVYHRDMMGGVNVGGPSLTAFVLITMAECPCKTERVRTAAQLGLEYLENSWRNVENPYALAVSAYAMALLNSPSKRNVNDKLISKERRDDIGLLNVGDSSEGTPFNVESTSYFLLTQLQLDDINKCEGIVEWLIKQRKSGGAFQSTQDTVIGLQALTEYNIVTFHSEAELVIDVTDENIAKQIQIKQQNADVQKSIKHGLKPRGHLTISAQGSGTGRLVVDINYNRKPTEGEICQFEVSNIQSRVMDRTEKLRAEKPGCGPCGDQCESEEVDVADGDYDGALGDNVDGKPREDHEGEERDDFRRSVNGAGHSKPMYCVSFTIRYNNPSAVGPSGMSIVDFGIPTGYKIVEDEVDFKTLRNKEVIDSYDIPQSGKGKIIMYLDEVSQELPVNFTFRLVKDIDVAYNLQASPIHVYQYDSPKLKCMKLYAIDSVVVPEIGHTCDGDTCKCLQGECAKPLQKKFEAIAKPRCNRQKIEKCLVPRWRKRACNPDEADYVLKVEIISEATLDEEFNQVKWTAIVRTVIKKGIEALHEEEEIEFFKNLLCQEPNLERGKIYYITAKDGEKIDSKHTYPLMDTAMIIEKKDDWSPGIRTKVGNFEKAMKKGCQD